MTRENASKPWSEVLLWPLAGAIALASLATELMPVIFGTGAQARFDWGLPYVTLRFGVLPLACLMHLCWSGVLLAQRRRGQPVGHLLAHGSSVLLPITYLAALLVDPVFWLRSFFS